MLHADDDFWDIVNDHVEEILEAWNTQLLQEDDVLYEDIDKLLEEQEGFVDEWVNDFVANAGPDPDDDYDSDRLDAFGT